MGIRPELRKNDTKRLGQEETFMTNPRDQAGIRVSLILIPAPPYPLFGQNAERLQPEPLLVRLPCLPTLLTVFCNTSKVRWSLRRHKRNYA